LRYLLLAVSDELSTMTQRASARPTRQDLARVLERTRERIESLLRRHQCTSKAATELLREAAALLTEILGTPGPERRTLLDSGVRFHSLQLCQLLEDRSRDAWFSDPARAVHLAELAVATAERLDDKHYDLPLAEDARASAWAHLGNAYGSHPIITGRGKRSTPPKSTSGAVGETPTPRR
jgi:hypothetical protein